MHESGYGQITLSDSPASIRYLGKTLKAWREGYLNQSWAEISRCCGGSPCGTTIKNLENGVTMKPHYLTVMSLLQALGFKTVTTHESHASRKTTRQLRKVA